jgi:hypothetical protein
MGVGMIKIIILVSVLAVILFSARAKRQAELSVQ